MKLSILIATGWIGGEGVGISTIAGRLGSVGSTVAKAVATSGPYPFKGASSHLPTGGQPGPTFPRPAGGSFPLNEGLHRPAKVGGTGRMESAASRIDFAASAPGAAMPQSESSPLTHDIIRRGQILKGLLPGTGPLGELRSKLGNSHFLDEGESSAQIPDMSGVDRVDNPEATSGETSLGSTEWESLVDAARAEIGLLTPSQSSLSAEAERVSPIGHGVEDQPVNAHEDTQHVEEPAMSEAVSDLRRKKTRRGHRRRVGGTPELAPSASRSSSMMLEDNLELHTLTTYVAMHECDVDVYCLHDVYIAATPRAASAAWVMYIQYGPNLPDDGSIEQAAERAVEILRLAKWDEVAVLGGEAMAGRTIPSRSRPVVIQDPEPDRESHEGQANPRGNVAHTHEASRESTPAVMPPHAPSLGDGLSDESTDLSGPGQGRVGGDPELVPDVGIDGVGTSSGHSRNCLGCVGRFRQKGHQAWQAVKRHARRAWEAITRPFRRS